MSPVGRELDLRPIAAPQGRSFTRCTAAWPLPHCEGRRAALWVLRSKISHSKTAAQQPRANDEEGLGISLPGAFFYFGQHSKNYLAHTGGKKTKISVASKTINCRASGTHSKFTKTGSNPSPSARQQIAPLITANPPSASNSSGCCS